MSRNIAGIVLFSMALTVVGQAAAKEKFVVQPVQVGAETVRYEQGVATVELFNRQGSVQIQPLPIDHGSLAFYVGVYNAGHVPANIDISNFSIRAGDQTLAVFSRQELEKKAKNRAMWTQIGLAALGGLAAAGAASQRDTYHSTFYTPRAVYHGHYSAPSAAGQIQAAAITAGTGYAIYNVQQRLDRTRAELANSVVQLSTIDPDDSYGGKIVLAKIKDKKLPKVVTIDLDWNGERYPFSFRLVKPGTPAPAFTITQAAVAPAAPEVAAINAGISMAPAAPVDLPAEVARTARDTSTPLAFMDKTTVSKIEAQGDRLVLTASVDQKGAILTESGRRQLVRKICETNGSLLGAGATVHLDLFEKGQAKGPAFGSVTATRRDCMI